MPQQYEVDNAQAHIRLARYLMSKADQRGMTHGEKHHLIQVSLHELSQALFLLGDTSYSVVSRNENDDPRDVQIPLHAADDKDQVRDLF